MRVAMIGPFGLKPKGTMAVRALPLAKALVRRGHQATLILPPWSYPQDSVRVWDEDGVRVANVTISPRWMMPQRLVSTAMSWHPDVIHFFKPKGYSGLTAWWVWQMRRIGAAHARLVLDTDDWEGAGGWNEVENYSGAQKTFFARQEQWGLRHADAVTVASRALETIVWTRRGRNATGTVHYLPNGVLPWARRDESARDAIRAAYGFWDAPVALLYTRFVEFHVERFVEIFARIKERVPDVHLLVIGKGLFEEEKILSAIVAARGWQDRVAIAGWVQPEALPQYFAAADIALYPFDDTLINRCKCAVKLVDLLAAGVPVVAEAVGQNKEYIRQNETGLLVRPGSVDEFANAGANLLHDADVRKRLGACAAETMSREYNWDKLGGIAEEAYGTLTPDE